MPQEFYLSAEADVFPLNRPERAKELIDGAIGEGAPLSSGIWLLRSGRWRAHRGTASRLAARLVSIENANTAGIVGLCLEVNDLAVSKYIAGRPKDLDFTRELAKHAMTNPDTLIERVKETDISAHQLRSIVLARIGRDFGISTAVYPE